MIAKLRSWWQKIKHHPYITGITLLLVLVFILFIFLAYRFAWDWTGFNSGTSQIIIKGPPQGNYTATVSQPGKSLWDWLTLLAIPVVVGLGAVWYTGQQEKVRDLEKTDIQHETTLQTYIDKMSELILPEGGLDPSKVNSKSQELARARTLLALRRLDSNRKGILLQFLYDTGLIFSATPIIDLSTPAESVDIPAVADLILVANLSEANLRDAYLPKAKLSRINLRQANLRRATLTEADLSGSDLSGADLHGANLNGAILNNAKLLNANLSKANLSSAQLSAVKISGANLRDANLINALYISSAELEKNSQPAKEVIEEQKKNKLLQGATMPDGSKHP